MMFVDGENLAIRYRAEIAEAPPKNHVVSERDVFVWSRFASRVNGPEEYIRRYYYTTCPGDAERHTNVEQTLRSLGIEAPRVFHKPRNGRSKRVDITLATDMLTHAHRQNYDIAILVAGDEDYVPLVEAVQNEGRRVAVWFLSNGLSSALKAAADHYWDMSELLFHDETDRPAFGQIFR